MTIKAQAPIQVRKVANGFIITPAAGDEFVSDAVTLVFSDEVGVTKWLCQHFEPERKPQPAFIPVSAGELWRPNGG
jgi:hypothetical protein